MTEPTRVAPAIDIASVCKSFPRKSVEALRGVDLRVEGGQFASLIGPSGCGKSTLLKLIGGLSRPSSGTILLSGSPVDQRMSEIGFMFQKSVLIPWLTAVDNVLLPRVVSAGRRAAKREHARAEALLDLVGVGGFASAYPYELSGGMAQRVAICRMLITNPRLLLLDEPFGALDEITRDHMNIELQRVVGGSNATSVMVTHSIQEAVFLSDVIFVMAARPGRVIEVIHNPLARPRTLDLIASAEFQAIASRVRRGLDEASVKVGNVSVA